MPKDDPAKYELYEQAKIAFEKLCPKPGDIIVVKMPDNIVPEQMEVFARYMEDVIPDGITVFCTRDQVEMNVLPKEELNALGWYNFSASSKGLLN